MKPKRKAQEQAMDWYRQTEEDNPVEDLARTYWRSLSRTGFCAEAWDMMHRALEGAL